MNSKGKSDIPEAEPRLGETFRGHADTNQHEDGTVVLIFSDVSEKDGLGFRGTFVLRGIHCLDKNRSESISGSDNDGRYGSAGALTKARHIAAA